jgi:type II secretory pathway component PulF
VRLLEPIMLLILAAIVLFVVIALLMPVIKMSGRCEPRASGNRNPVA